MAFPNNIRELITAGFDQMQIAVLDSNGWPAGIAGSVSAGNVASMRRFGGVKTANVQIPEIPIVSVTGDDGLLGTFQFASNEPRQFDLDTGELDLNILNASQGTSIYQIASYYDTVLFDPQSPSFIDALCIFTSQSQSIESGQRGSGYFHLVLPHVQFRFRGNERKEQEAGTFNWQATINFADKFPWGTAFATDNVGKLAASGFLFFSKNRMTLDTYRMTGSDTTYLLSRVPYTDANGIVRVATWYSRTGGVEGKEVTDNTSVVAATKTITVSGVSPKASGDYLFNLVEYA